jgi:outer membrane lipoprotein carrier protein
MKKFIVKLVLIILFISSPLISFAAPSDQLTQLLQSFNSMQANFTQTLQGSRSQPAKTSSGTMALQRPGKFRWQTISPNQQLLVADGKYLWVYYKDLNQATRQQLSNGKTVSPAALLSGSVDAFKQRFNIASPGPDIFKLTPKSPNDLFQSIQLQFQNNQLVQMVMVDNLGQTSILKFTNIKTNTGISPSVFQFQVPKGVDLIKE